MITGQGTISVRKQELENQRIPSLGFVKSKFAHKASAGATGITLTALSTPPEMSANGFTNPSSSQIANANLLFYRNNLRLTSSTRGLLEDYIDYTIAGSTQINFVNFTALEGEIFIGTIDYNAQTGLTVANNTSMPVSYSLPAGQTQVNLGQVFPTGKWGTTSIGSVMVLKDGVLQNRNSGNATSLGDGNYFELDNGTGYFSQIQFNTSETYATTINVIPTAWIIEQGNGSMQSQIESINGFLNNMGNYVAAVTGQPLATIVGGQPTNVDLTTFGNRVYSLEQNRALLGSSNLWTAFQAIPGRTDGNPVPALDVGEVQVLLNNTSLVSYGNTQNAYMDSLTFTVQPGSWLLVAAAQLHIDTVTGGGAGDGLVGSVSIRQGSTTIAETAIGSANLNVQRFLGGAPVITSVDLSAATTYKLSVYLRTISAAVSVSGSYLRGDYTPTKVIAIRKA